MSDHVFRKIETSGIYSLAASRWPAVESAAAKEHLRLLSATIPPRASKDKALAQIGTDLHLPAWYGANFDALFDCLTDPDWFPAKGHIILIKGVAVLRTSDPEAFATLIEVLKAVADARKDAGMPFWALIDTPARDVAAFPEA